MNNFIEGRPVLGFLIAVSPIAMYNFPAQIYAEGLTLAKPDNLIPRKKGKWNHWAKNYLVETVRADVQFWAQGLAAVFWYTHIFRTVLEWMF